MANSLRPEKHVHGSSAALAALVMKPELLC